MRKPTRINFVFLFAFFALIVLASMLFAGSVSDSGIVKLVQGNNVVSFNVSNPFSVQTFVELNPDIQTVSYRDGNETIGYVNALGGVGKNFTIESGREYEIFSSSNITLNIPG